MRNAGRGKQKRNERTLEPRQQREEDWRGKKATERKKKLIRKQKKGFPG